MNTRNKILLAFLLSFLGTTSVASGQINEDLFIYGYFQGTSRYSHLESNPLPEVNRAWNFSVQQLNLFMFKQIDANFSGFVNLEITNSLSTEDGWGSIALDEAWMKYDRTGTFKIKAGLLIPTFNNLNAIKDKTPLLPYLLRPFAYETFAQEFFSTDELVPRQAAIEIYGSINLGRQTKFDYAAYIGNNIAFITSEAVSTIPSGADTTTTKLIGTRIGLRHGAIKFGISVTKDNADISQIPIFLATDISEIDKVPRNRIGVDFSLTYSRLFFESEFIHVNYLLSEMDKETIARYQVINPLLSDELDKIFAYITLGYYFGEKWFSYGMYSYYQDKSNVITDNGFGMYSIGAGFRPNDYLVFKIQSVYASTYKNDFFFGREKDLMIGLSVFL